MKKFFALILAVVMMLSVAAFAEEADTTATVMTHEEFVAAELESEVTVETYVQDKQSWWDNKATFYCQSEDGAYFIYEMPCTEDEYAQLVPGTKIRVTGYKAEWSGEVEITDATFEILEADPYIAEATDVTELLGTDELINHQNEKVAFTGLTVEAYDESGVVPSLTRTTPRRPTICTSRPPTTARPTTSAWSSISAARTPTFTRPLRP